MKPAVLRPVALGPDLLDELEELVEWHSAGRIGELLLDVTAWPPDALAYFLSFAPRIVGLGLLAPEGSVDPRFLEPFTALRTLTVRERQGLSLAPVSATLVELRAVWTRSLDLLRCRGLSDLSLRGYGPRSRDLGELSSFDQLRSLELIHPRVQSLTGIPRGVRALTVFQARSLSTLDGVEALLGLEALHLDGCRRLTDLSVLSALPSLRSLRIHRQDVQTLSFVERLTLRSFRMVDGRVLDGQVGALSGLEELHFEDRPGYSHRRDAIARRKP